MARQRTGNVSVTTNARDVLVGFERFAKQVPWATVVSLNTLARGARDLVRAELPTRFTLRSPAYIKRSVVSRNARKSDWPRPRSVVGELHEWMAVQETGGVLRSPKGGRLAVPSRIVRPRGSRRRISRAQWPGRLIARGRARAIERRGDSRGLVVGDVRRRRTAARNLGSSAVLYWLRRRVTIPPRWGFRRTVANFARANYSRVFRSEWGRIVKAEELRIRAKLGGSRGTALGRTAGRSRMIRPASVARR